jgi:hypothetical protein
MNQGQTLPIVCMLAGFILLYGAIRNRNPLEVIKNTLTGKGTGGTAIQGN